MKSSADDSSYPEQCSQQGELRRCDVQPVQAAPLTVTIDGRCVPAYPGETVLSILYSLGQKAISRDDRGSVTGAYCGMGVCYSCTVLINGQKQRACQSIIRSGMRIETCKSLFEAYEEEAHRRREGDHG